MIDAVIIGGGHNGLAAAFYLAQAGRKTLVLEAADDVGGGAITADLHKGFKCPTLAHDVCLHAQVAEDMNLARFGVRFITPAARVCAVSPDGPPLVLYDDVGRSVESVRPFSTKDAEAYPEYRRAVERVASVVGSVLEATPPDIDHPSGRDLWNLLRTGRRFRSLGRRDEYRLLRWLPMPAADLVDEWFTNDLLRAAIAAPGVSGTMMGPRSAGSGLVMLLREAHRRLAGGMLRVAGGPGALTRAMADAAVAAGATIRTNAAVERILVRDGRAAGVISNGSEISSRLVVSAIDPKTTFLRLVEPTELTPAFAAKLRNYRAAGTLAKVNLALSRLPAFRGVPDSAMLSGHVHIGRDLDYLERAFDQAKYGEFSTAPWLDVTIPSIADPQLAPAGAHVMSVYVHYAPYRLRSGGWDGARPALLEAVFATLETCAPGLRSVVLHAQVFTPEDLEKRLGVAGGHVFHGELAPDQLFAMRPLLGYGRYSAPIENLHLCSAGTHPGGFMTGASGRLAAREILRHL
jgi:phytoene dehydrogenase-like protein